MDSHKTRENSIDIEKTKATPVYSFTEWNSLDDPDNPFNWSLAKKIYHTATPGLIGLGVTFASSVYTPAYEDVEQHFGVGSTAALLPLSLYVLATAFGPQIAAPISETMGRRPVYLITIPVFMLFILGAGFSHTFAQLLVCRFFAGAFGAPVLAVGAGTLADMWRPRYMASTMVIFVLSPYLGTALGPVVGGYVAMKKNFRWTQWVTLMLIAPIYLLSLGMSETYRKIILKKRALAHGKQAPVNHVPPKVLVKTVFTITLARPLLMIVKEPIVFFFGLYVAFNFGIMFAFFAAFPIVFQGIYHFNVGEGGLTFLSISLGSILACLTTITVDKTMYAKQIRKAAAEGSDVVRPEHRLYVGMMGTFGISVSLFWFAWTARAGVSWASPLVAAIVFGWGNLCIFSCSSLYQIDVYGPGLGASALAANGIMRYTFACVFPLFTIQMYDKLGVDWATSLFGFVSLALLPIPFVLFRFGERLRARSSFVPTVAAK